MAEKTLATRADLVGAVAAGLERLLACVGVGGAATSDVIHATTMGSNAGLGPSRGSSIALAPPGASADFRAFVAHGRDGAAWARC